MSDKLFENIKINISEQLNNFKNEIQNIIETKIKSEIGNLLDKINDKFLNLSSNKKRNEEILQNFILQITENTEILKYLKDYTDNKLNIETQTEENNNLNNKKIVSKNIINKEKSIENEKNKELNDSDNVLKDKKQNENLENNLHVYEDYDDINKKENKDNKEKNTDENNINLDNIIDNNIPDMIFPESLSRNYNSFNYSIEYEFKEIDDIYLQDLKDSSAYINITLTNNGEIDWPKNCYICCNEEQEKTGIFFDDTLINNGDSIKVGEKYSDKIYLRTQENFVESDEYILSYEIKINKKQSLNSSQTGMYIIKLKRYKKTNNNLYYSQYNNNNYNNRKKKNKNKRYYKKKEEENNSYIQNDISDKDFNNL